MRVYFFVEMKLLVVVTCFAVVVNSEYLRKEHTFVRPYQGPFWDLVGNTLITSQFSRLTADTQSQRGGLWNVQPVLYHNWEVHIQYHIHGKGSDGLHGDGLAFWYVKEPGDLGDVFGYKNFFTGLGIFIDTYSNHNGPHNHRHPYVSAMINNGSLSYDHDRDGTITELAGCETGGRNKDYDTYMAIRYLDNKLTVSMDVDNEKEWKECFTVDNVMLPTGFYLGFSAATGDLADNHDILSVKFYELESQLNKEEVDYSNVQPSASIFSPPRDHIDDPKPGFFSGAWSGLKLLLIIVLICVALGIMAVVGYLVFQKQQDNARKRFY